MFSELMIASLGNRLQSNGTAATRLVMEIASRRGLPMRRKRYYRGSKFVNGSFGLMGQGIASLSARGQAIPRGTAHDRDPLTASETRDTRY